MIRAPFSRCDPLEVALALWSLLAGVVLSAPGRLVPPGSVLATVPEWVWAGSFLATGTALLVGLTGWRLLVRRVAALALCLLSLAGAIGVWQVSPGSWVVPAFLLPTFYSALVYHALG